MDDQARRDAMADAETLLSVSWGCEANCQQSRGVLVNVLRASDEGEFALAEMAPAGRIQVLYAHGAAAARAAFRAVPGLKGDK